MSDRLKSKTLRAFFWSFMERIGQQGIQFFMTIILARLLMPEEFGLIAMLSIFIAIAYSFINSGFGQALIQKKDATHIDECSIFYFNILVGFLAAGLLCIAAPWIADFYKQPQLILMTYALSLNLIINAFSMVQRTLCTKQIDFKTQLKVSAISTVISGAIAIAMAYNGYGVWSLVALSLGDNLFRTILWWGFSTWRPSRIFNFNSLRTMFAFGSRILGFGLLEAVFQNGYLMVIGKLFSPMSLGFYSRADTVQQFPVNNITVIINQVTFPVFSSVQDDKHRLKRGVSMVLTMQGMIIFPLMVGLAIVTRPLVLVLFTEKWLPCVPYLQLLCMVGMLYPIISTNMNVLNAQGHSKLFLRLEVLKKFLFILAIAITYRWGIIAMIYGQIALSCFAYFLSTYYTGKMLDYPITEQIRDLIPSLALTGIMGLGVYVLKYIPFTNQLALLSIQIIAGLMLYAGGCYIFRVSSFMEIIKLIQTKLLKTNTISEN
jgi:O-antigen/teichoic acid export membrane protein